MSAINSAVFSLQERATGRWYAEVVPTANVAGSLAATTLIGVTYQAAPDAFAAPTDLGVGASPSGATTFDGVTLTPMAGYASGDTVMIAFDADTGEVWFGVNGTFTGDPVAGTNPANEGFLLPAGTFKIFVAFEPNVFNPGEGTTSVLQAKASQQTYTAPTGFLPWEDV
jgi:hypothetical protein